MKLRTKIIMIIVLVVYIFVLLYFDYKNIISNLGLSVSFWSGFITGIIPVFLTIYLWKIEQKERIEQIEKETKQQKRLMLSSFYIEYFEKVLIQLDELLFYINVGLLKKDDLINNKKELKSYNMTFKFVKEEYNPKNWWIDYKEYAFKTLDIDVCNYNFNGNIVNLRSFKPLLNINKQLKFIYDEKEIIGEGKTDFIYQKTSIKRQKEIFNNIIKDQTMVEQLYEFVTQLKKDIENKLAYE